MAEEVAVPDELMEIDIVITYECKTTGQRMEATLKNSDEQGVADIDIVFTPEIVEGQHTPDPGGFLAMVYGIFVGKPA